MKQLSLAIILCFFCAANSLAVQKESGWIFSALVGVNKLDLHDFYDTVYNAPFVGTVRINTDLPEDVEGASSYPSEQFYFENKLHERTVDVEASLEMRRYFGLKSDFFIGIGAWETIAESTNVIVTFPLQGQRNNRATYDRRGKLSYTQYYLGVQHYLNSRSAKFNAYINVSIREMFDIDYEETNVFNFISGEPKGFKRIFIFHSQATGLLMTQFGLGAQYRFAERFSIGLEGAYAFHIKDGVLKGVTVNNDYNDGDGITTEPLVLNVVNPLLDTGALDEDGVNYEKVRLRFDGWHMLIKFNITF